MQQTANMIQCNALFNLRNTLGRMNANLVSLNSPQGSLTVAGGNLFQIAEGHYGDAMAWTALARANGLTDPYVQGAVTLAVPTSPGDTGGVLES